MPNEIFSSISASIGVLMSAIIASIVSTKKFNKEREEFKVSQQRASLEKILDVRLECYPQLYSIISDLSKKISFKKITLDDVVNATNAINNWDNLNAILLSGKATNELAVFRYFIYEIVEKENTNSFQEKIFLESFKEEFLDKISHLELALKSDLGIFTAEFCDIDLYIDNYSDLFKKIGLHKSRKKIEKGIAYSN